MNSLVHLKKSALSSSAKRATLAAFTTSIDSLLNLKNPRTISTTAIDPPRDAHHFCKNGAKTASWGSFTSGSFSDLGFGFGRRSFHVGGSGQPLNFRSSAESVADFPDEVSASASKGSADGGLEIAKLGISESIVSALAGKGITKLFPIQKAVLEPAMQGRDMIGRARTGTGKTLAFGIPIMDKIIKFNDKHGRGRAPLALVLAPTRELARQVEKEFYESSPVLETLCVYGGSPLQRQMSLLQRGVDIVVGTPGRVIDLIKRGSLDLSQVQFIVLDEADQMLNVGFADDVETILQNLPQNRQSMMFSATMPSWIVQLTRKYLKNPLTIDLVGDSDRKLADGISLYAIASERNEKPKIIQPLIDEHANGGKCIVFTQTKRDADSLAHYINKTMQCEALHGDISQNQRERTLSGFRSGSFNVLVATDVAARGLDVPNVDLVIHYELPNTSETFVHRSGRTGRAGKKGTAILIYSSQQMRDVRGIERDVGSKFAELPRIAVESGPIDFGGGGGRSYGSMGGGGYGGSGYGRSGGSGGSGYGRSGGYGGSSSGRSGGFGESNSGRFGSSYGGSSSGRSGGGFGGPSRPSNSGSYMSDRQSGYGNSGAPSRSSSFGDFGSSRTSGDFSDSRKSLFGDLTTGRKAF